jgi:phosphate/sulfate permease
MQHQVSCAVVRALGFLTGGRHVYGQLNLYIGAVATPACLATVVSGCADCSPVLACLLACLLLLACRCLVSCSQHHYQQMRKEADKQWPSSNKKLDWMIALAHGT